MTAVFDIETIALPWERIEASMALFDPESVKLGNVKDEAKKAEKIAEAERNYIAKLRKDAALDARTSRCKMAGFLHPEDESIVIYVHEEDAGRFKILREYAAKVSVELVARRNEREFLQSVILRIQDIAATDGGKLVSYYGNQFDLPFLFRRSWCNGVPAHVGSLKRGRYFRENIIDLYELWGFGEKFPSTGGLEGLGKSLGCEMQKTGEGFQFGELYERDPAEGMAYLIADLKLTADAAGRMGVL